MIHLPDNTLGIEEVFETLTDARPHFMGELGLRVLVDEHISPNIILLLSGTECTAETNAGGDDPICWSL